MRINWLGESFELSNGDTTRRDFVIKLTKAAVAGGVLIAGGTSLAQSVRPMADCGGDNCATHSDSCSGTHSCNGSELCTQNHTCKTNTWPMINFVRLVRASR